MVTDLSKMRSDDRILKLKQIPGKSPLSSSGLTDKRLFTGGNNIHAIRDTNGLWYLQYDNGLLEEALKQRFTSFSSLMKHVKYYYLRRNIMVEEVLD